MLDIDIANKVVENWKLEGIDIQITALHPYTDYGYDVIVTKVKNGYVPINNIHFYREKWNSDFPKFKKDLKMKIKEKLAALESEWDKLDDIGDHIAIKKQTKILKEMKMLRRQIFLGDRVNE